MIVGRATELYVVSRFVIGRTRLVREFLLNLMVVSPQYLMRRKLPQRLGNMLSFIKMMSFWDLPL